MKQLPTQLHVNNINSFHKQFINRKMTLLRSKIYDFMISRKSESEYYDMDMFCKEHLNNDRKLLDIFNVKIMEELKTIGWNCKLFYGNTAIFIYSKDEPSACNNEII